jgi:3-phenylpropionate/trans-cinnamate dioxygenase ferredoxin reductase component
MSGEPETLVIVGAGLAGAKAVETLRAEGFEGRIMLIGEEPERPYERPPLSKEYLRGETADKPYVHDERYYADNEIDLLESTTVRGLDAGSRELLLDGDRRLRFDGLLFATGAEPRRLDVPGSDLDGIHYLRTVADSDRIGERIAARERLVVVGSGWIGAEAAASARQAGCDVTVIEMSTLPLERVLGPELGRLYLDIHRDHGVEFLPETTVERFEGAGSVERVITRDGAALDAQFVVVGIGVSPRVALAENAGLSVDNGILVDEGLEASTPGIFAAGDVANAHHPFYGRRVRIEHWANALNQGPAAARSMLGRDVSYDEIPYFFSDQYDVGMEYSGFAETWDRVVLRGDSGSRELIAFWIEDRRVIAAMNVNVWDVHDALRDLIRSRQEVDPERLADPDVALDELVADRASLQ